MKHLMKKTYYSILNFFWTLFNHRKVIKNLETELMKPLELRLKKFETLPEGGFEIAFESPIFKVFASIMCEALIRTGEGYGNFITSALHYNMQQFSITIQKNGGITPGERIRALMDLTQRMKQLLDQSKPFDSVDSDAKDQWANELREVIELYGKKGQ